MWGKIQRGIVKAQADLCSVTEEMSRNIQSFQGEFKEGMVAAAGVRKRRRKFVGAVEFRNLTDSHLQLTISKPTITGGTVTTMCIDPRGVECFDAGETSEFDFYILAKVLGNVTRFNALRECVYEVAWSGSELVATKAREEPRIVSDRLATVRHLSFSFSASGWLFIYQLGVAHCLQKHGIAKNPYMRVSGASGGALTAAVMMYGCDMRTLRDHVKNSVTKVKKDVSQGMNLRLFILEAMQLIIRDGSIEHPAFKEGRVEIGISESGFEAKQSFTSRVSALGKGQAKIFKGTRRSKFERTSEVAVALLASATMGISGLPFNMTNEEGKEVKVGDGAVTDFLPVIDDLSVTVVPFSEGNFKSSTIAPSEFVPGNWGVWPPLPSTIDHLFELGYRDMEEWIEYELDARIEAIKAKRQRVKESKARGEVSRELPGEDQSSEAQDEESDGEERPPVDFLCLDDNLTWLEEVLASVPIAWGKQLSTAPRPPKTAWTATSDSSTSAASKEAANSSTSTSASSGGAAVANTTGALTSDSATAAATAAAAAANSAAGTAAKAAVRAAELPGKVGPEKEKGSEEKKKEGTEEKEKGPGAATESSVETASCKEEKEKQTEESKKAKESSDASTASPISSSPLPFQPSERTPSEAEGTTKDGKLKD